MTTETQDDVVEKFDVAAKLKEVDTEIKSFVQKANEEISVATTLSQEVKSAIESLTTKATDLGERLSDLEGKGGVEETPEAKTIGQSFAESEHFERMKSGSKHSGKMEVKSFYQKDILNATGQNQPIVPDMRLPGVVRTPDRMLRIRSILASGQTTSNLIQYTKELLFTNNAAPQAGEGVAKAKSDITFELANAPVQTLAHYIVASKQVLDDAPFLQGYIDTRLRYGLEFEEEDQLLNGDGTAQNLNGLLNQATAYNTGLNAVGDTKIDTIRHALLQATLSEYLPDAVVLNYQDWHDIELVKTSEGAYVFANPTALASPMLWGTRVVPSLSIAAGSFLVGSMGQAAQVWDRMNATVEMTEFDQDNFIKNMVTIRAEERLALTVYRPSALITGAFV